MALALFHRRSESQDLEVWVQVRTDDGPFHGLLEFPGGGVEPGETPLMAAVREVQEEVGITIDSKDGRLLGIYKNELSHKTILLHVFIFPESSQLERRGQWLKIEKATLSEPFRGKIPPMNHDMIDDLYRSLYDQGHE